MGNVKEWDISLLALFSPREQNDKMLSQECPVLGSQSRKIKYTTNYFLIDFNSIIYKLSKWNSTFFFLIIS